MQNYLNKSWKLFEGKEIVQLEINFRNLISFIEAHLKTHKSLQNAESTQILMKSLDFLLQFLNKLIFYDFKMKLPMDSPLFRDEDLLNLLIFSDDWPLIFKYLTALYKLMNYNGWKLDTLDFLKQKRIFMIAYSFLSPNTAHFPHVFSLIEAHPIYKELYPDKAKIKDYQHNTTNYTIRFYHDVNKANIQINLQELLEEVKDYEQKNENNLILSDIGIEKDKTDMKNHDSNLEKNLIEDKPNDNLGVETQKMTKNTEKISNDKKILTCYEYARLLSQKFDIKETSLEFYELLFEIKLRNSFYNTETQFCFVIIGTLFGHMLFDLDFNQFIGQLNLISFECFSLKEIDRNQRFLYLLSLTQKNSDLLMTSLILLNEMKKPEYQIIEINNQNSNNLLLELKIMDEFKNTCELNQGNYEIMKLLLRFSLNFRIYLKSIRLKTFKFDLLKEVARLMESLDQFVLNLFKDFFKDEEIFPYKENIYLLEDFSAYNLVLQQEKPMIIHEIGSFKDVVSLKESDYVIYMMVRLFFSAFEYFKQIMNDRDTLVLKDIPLLDHLILTPVKYFGLRKQVFLVKIFINEGIFSELLVNFKKNNSNSIILKSYIHTLINNVLYYSLSQEPELKEFIYHSSNHEFLSILGWFQIFCQSNIVVFLCNFSLMRLYIEELAKTYNKSLETMISSLQNKTFCETYVEIVLKDLLLWGSSGIKLLDEIIVIRLLKPIFVIKFEEMLKELKNMIEGDLLELEQFFIIKEKQVISENFISFFVYLGYKYQKITINLNFILNTLFSETYFGSKIPRKLYNEYLHVFFQLALPFLGGIPKEALNSNQYHTIEETNHYPISIITNNLKHHLISSRSVLTDFQSLLTSNQTPIFYNMYSQYAEKLFQSLLNGKIHLKGIESFQTIRSVNIIEANLGLLKWMLQKYNKVEFYKENHLDVLEDLKVVYGEVLEWYDVFLDLIVNEYYVRLQGQWKDFEKANEQDFDRIWKFLKNHVANLTSITKALSEKNRLFRYITNLSKRIIKFSQIIKDLNKTSQDFTLQVLDLKLSLLKRKYLENKLENKGFLEVLKNLFWLDEIYRIFKHGHAYIKGELPWIIFNEDFLEKTIQIMSEIINPYITDHPQLNLEFFENKNHENPKFLELEFQFKYFICFFNEICCKFLIQKPYEELFHSLSENKELSQIENQKIFDRKLDKIVILNKEIMKFWKNLNRWNEDIPENMTNVYERVYKIVIQDNKIAPTFKEKIDKIGFKILELFLYSTYDNHIRIRSCYAFSIIHQLIINKINDDGLYLQEKKHFCSYFIHILSKHFQSIWQDWLLESSPLLLEISNKFNKPIEISYLPDINKLDHMTNCCTHAMILNLVSRLIQDGSTLDPKIEDGVSLMFNDWRSIYEYNRYVAEIFLKMKDRRLIDDEIKTLDYDTIENGISLLKKAIHTQNNISVNYEELLDICLLLLENYLSHHEAQMLFDPKREYAKLDKIKSFLELYLFALNHILTKDNKSLLFHNFSMRVLNKLKRIKYSNLQEKNKFQHSTHILLTRICDIFMFFDQSEFLSANLLIKLQAIFYDSERQTIKENIPLEVLCKDEEMNALFGAHYMIFLETFLSYCDISQNNTQNILVMIKPEAWGKKGKLILDGYQQEILDFFIDRTVESFENLTINIKSKESIEYDIIDSCYTMNMLAFFSGKYPLLIPLIAGKKIASKSVFFIDYLLDISARYYNIGKRLFLSFITINYSFDVIYKNNIGEYHKNDHSNNESNTNILKIPFITTSGFVWRKYFNEVLFQKIQKLFKDQTNFLKSPSNAISWKLCLELLNFLNSNISKENNNKENKEFQSKLNKFLWEIVETRENLDDFFILEQSNTFDILAHFYMTTIEDNFKKYTGITFEKKKHMKYLKENLNLFFQNFEQSPFDLSNLLQSTTESSIDQNENLQNPFLKQRKEEKIEIFNFNFNFNPFLLLSANENPNFISQENPNPFLLLSHEQNIEKPILSLKDSLKNTEFISEILKIKASSKVNAISINKLHLLYIESSNSSELERNWINLHNNWMNKGKSINQKLASLLTYLESRKTGSQKLNLVDSIEFFKTLNSSFEAFPPYLKNIGESLLFDLDSPLRSPANSQKNNDLYLTLMDLSVELLVKDDPSIQSPYDKDKNGNNNNIKEEEKTIIKLDEEENKEDEMLNFINNKEEHSNQIKQINHIFLDLGIPPDYMSLYKIDEALFTGFSLQEKIDYLLEKQSFFEEKSQLNSSNNFLFDFSDFNYPVNALELYEIDPAFFNGIPLEYKLEVLDQAKRDYEEKQKKLSKKLNEEKKIDYELIKQKFYIHRELKLMGFWKDHTEFEIKEFNEEINEDLNEIISLLQFYLDQNENKIANKILLLLPKNILEKFPENLRLMGLEAKSKVLEGGINEVINFLIFL